MAIGADGNVSGIKNYATPTGFYGLVCKTLGCDPQIDVCAVESTSKAAHWYGPGSVIPDALDPELVWGTHPHIDGLARSGWMNPEFGPPVQPCPKACKKPATCTRRKRTCGAAKGGLHIAERIPGIEDWCTRAADAPIPIVALLPNNCRETEWWHDTVVGKAAMVHDVAGRVHFRLNGKRTNGASINVCIVQYIPGDRPFVPVNGPVIDWASESDDLRRNRLFHYL